MIQDSPGGSAEDLDRLASEIPASKPKAWEQSPIPVREQARKNIAVILLSGYIILILGVLAHVFWGYSPESDSKDLITLLITSYTTLLGSALGYYFGRQEN